MPRASQRNWSFAAAAIPIITLLLFGNPAEGKGPAPEQINFFEQKVRPLLAEKCFRCHGRGEQRSGLRLDSRQSILSGGDSGPAVVPGRPETSLLIEAINYRSLEMPPDAKLSASQIATLTRWVAMGAPWPKHAPKRSAETKITGQDRQHWSLQPLVSPEAPRVDDQGWCRNEIDRFIFHTLKAQGLSPAPAADRRAFIRRVYFDLIGLPPAPEHVELFVRDRSPHAYDTLIDRLLASPHYGERWGRHWLDLVRYAESDGHHQDRYRPEAWRYRDYVIDSLNQGKPFDRFIVEQLAGDEIAPDDPDALTATGYLRHWIYEGNQRKADEVRQIILNDVTDVTGEVFLGLSVACARCHDHKFDPILRKDYYQLQAFFAPMVPRDDVIAAVPRQRQEFLAMQAAWEQKTADIRRQIAELEAPIRQDKLDYTFELFPQHLKDLWRKPSSEQTPLERAIYLFADRHVKYEQRSSAIVGKLKGETRRRWDGLQRQLAEYESFKPDPPKPMVVRDIGVDAPITRIDGGGEPIHPNFPVVFTGQQPLVQRPPNAANSTGRRTALARWIASPDNPLTARVITNRIWQYHFGVGLVTTSSDFGRLGQPPSHPQLLDWLAHRFINSGWDFKQLHRLIMNSATYRQCAVWEGSDLARRRDPDNRWLWKMNIRRLDAEQIRDAVLATTGEMQHTVGGPSVDATVPRRTVYLKVFRNDPNPLLRTFDAPDGFNSTAQRDVSTTSTQALLLMNGPWLLERARRLADSVARTEVTPEGVITGLYQLMFGRQPDGFELLTATEFLKQRWAVEPETGRLGDRIHREQALVDVCHTLLNSNEFVYLD